MNANLPPSMNIEELSPNGTSIGDLLRASRNRRDEELREVSDALRIRQVYLEAIENNKFEELPGTIYAIGFIRTYAEYLGLDGEEVVRRYKSESTSAERMQDLTFPSLVPEHGIPGGAIVMLGLVLAAIGYGSWYYVSTKNIFVTEQVPAVPEKLAAIVGEKPVATEPIKTAEEQTSAANAAPVDNSSEKSEDQTEAKPEETPVATPVATPIETGQNVKIEEVVKDAAQPVENIAEKISEEVKVKTEDKVEEVKKVVADAPVKPKPTAAQETAAVETTEPAQPISPEVASKELESEPVSQEIVEKQEAPAPTAAPELKVEPNVEPVTEKVAEKVEEKVAEQVPTAEPVAEKKVEPAPETASEAAPESKPEPVAETKPAPAQEVAALPEIKPEIKPEPEPALEAAIKSAVATGNSRITLRAITDSYIQVRDNDADQLLITRLLKKGDSYNVPNRTGLSLITGNAGALEILVDGTAVPSIGPIGAVRRNVVLEAEKLIDGSAVVE
tara:strand:- start:6718 stop:8226 length:1509 start_codon:yes stop_codon:yes gene_type:complete